MERELLSQKQYHACYAAPVEQRSRFQGPAMGRRLVGMFGAQTSVGAPVIYGSCEPVLGACATSGLVYVHNEHNCNSQSVPTLMQDVLQL
ncbi:hypothetical protein WJX77_007801 [Trebouxia sp. C0004]